MTNDRDIPISASALPVSLNRRDADRRDAPTSLSQAEIHGLRRTRLLGLDELISPMVRRAVGYWMSKREADGPMLRRRLDAAEIPQLLPYLLLLEVVREAGQAAAPHPASGPRAGCRPERANEQRVNEQRVNEQPVISEMNPRLNFRYRVIGDVSLRHSRGNYTGKCLSEVDGQGPGSEVWRVCTEVALQRRPLLSRPPYIGPLSHIFQCESAVMPLVDDEGDVTRVLIACDFLPEPARSQLHAPQHQRG